MIKLSYFVGHNGVALPTELGGTYVMLKVVEAESEIDIPYLLRDAYKHFNCAHDVPSDFLVGKTIYLTRQTGVTGPSLLIHAADVTEAWSEWGTVLYWKTRALKAEKEQK